MWNRKIISLYIDDSSIRLLVRQGQRVKKWAEAKLEPGLIKGMLVQKEADVAGRISDLLRGQEISGKKVQLCFSGLHSLTRPIILPELPRSMIPEAVAREARRVLPVPLDQLYLSWKLLPSPRGRIHAFMAACPRNVVDALMRTLRGAGLEPAFMTIKPLVLTRIPAENTAILVDVQANDFDIVIMSEGVPQPIRTINFPEVELTPEQKLEMISSDLDRTIKFFDSNNPDRQLSPQIPVYISGELASQKDMHQILADSIGHPVKPLTVNLKGAELVNAERFTTNLAMIIQSAPSPAREATFGVASLNLLPAPYQPKPVSVTKLVAIPGAAAVVGVVVPMVLIMQSLQADVQSLERAVASTQVLVNQKVHEQNELKKSITGLENQATAVKAKLDKLKGSANYIAIRQEITSGDLTLALASVPASVELTGINESGNIFTIQGVTPDEKDILNYARALDKSGRFTETTITTLRKFTVEGSDGTQTEYQEFLLTFRRKG